MNRRNFLKGVGGAIAAALWPWRAQADIKAVTGLSLTSWEQVRRYAKRTLREPLRTMRMYYPPKHLHRYATPGSRWYIRDPADGDLSLYVVAQVCRYPVDEGGGMDVVLREVPPDHPCRVLEEATGKPCPDELWQYADEFMPA